MLIITRVKQITSLSFALALCYTFATAVYSKPIQISSRSNVNTIQGRSGGKVNSRGCGFIASQPNQVINVIERIDYMEISVKAVSGQPTLLIKGPNGNLCSLDANPKIAGMWVPGTYSIYVGDRTNSRHNFTLKISKQR